MIATILTIIAIYLGFVFWTYLEWKKTGDKLFWGVLITSGPIALICIPSMILGVI